jgi:hypothetical protein
LLGEDHLSSLIFYTDGDLPSGFTSSDRIKKIFSLAEAESLGILDDHADETKGTGGQVTVTGTWIVGEIVRIEIGGASLGQFVLTATSITSLVAGLVSAINANTNTGLRHGWVATDANPIVTLVQPAKLGVVNNAGSNLAFVHRNAADSAASAGGGSTDVQFSGGVGSYFAVMHYHISEFYRNSPKGVLWVSINAQGTYDGTEIKTVTDFAEGKIRQSGVLVTHESFASSQLTASQTVLDTVRTEHAPQNVVFHADLTSATLSTISNLTTLSNAGVSMLIGEDGDWHQAAYSGTKSYLLKDKVTFQGKAYIAKKATTGNSPLDGTAWTSLGVDLKAISGFSIGTVGTALGVIAFSSVHENIGATGRFNLVSGTGLQESAFATGDLWSDVTTALKDQLSDYSYIYLAKHRGLTGTFFNDSRTAIAQSNDFSTIENNRAVDKAERNIRTNNLNNLNSKLYVDTKTGNVSEDTMARFKNDTIRALIEMQNNGEINGTSDSPGYKVSINPEQDVLSTSEIQIAVVIVPVGVARQIKFDIGLTVKI